MKKIFCLLTFAWTPLVAADPVILHGDRQKPMVALTFDACPTIPQGQYEPLVIDTLIETQTPAPSLRCY